MNQELIRKCRDILAIPERERKENRYAYARVLRERAGRPIEEQLDPTEAHFKELENRIGILELGQTIVNLYPVKYVIPSKKKREVY